MTKIRYGLIALFALLVLGLNMEDVIDEIQSGESLVQMMDDALLLVLGLAVLVIVIVELRSQSRAIASLHTQLTRARGELEKLDSRAPEIGRQYRQVLQQQLDAWQLTRSEQEITILLLKGLSFREAAAVRSTQEKTVRQQAASVYKKAGVGGRHELAAWFFEDLLMPPMD